MFGFSLTKILFTAALVAVVWVGYRFLSGRGAARSDEPIADDTHRCATCGDFVVPEGAKTCQKPGCPYS